MFHFVFSAHVIVYVYFVFSALVIVYVLFCLLCHGDLDICGLLVAGYSITLICQTVHAESESGPRCVTLLWQCVEQYKLLLDQVFVRGCLIPKVRCQNCRCFCSCLMSPPPSPADPFFLRLNHHRHH